ncbi:MAG: hypothetical protein KDD37_00630 [Bdellovibrionales bacterium]|nr:hypothetical protein [Bdellovibrionales bacterium]
MQKFLDSWTDFWFHSFDEKRFRFFQIIFLATVFVLYGMRLVDYTFLFSESGILPFAMLKDLPELLYVSIPVEMLAKNDTLGFSLHFLFVALIGLTLFYRHIWLVAVALYALHIVFLRRNPMGVYGVDMVSTFWFLYMAFVNVKAKSKIWQALNSTMFRLIQIQLCIIYAYSGLDKAKGVTWWRGDAIWYALGNTQITSIDFSFLAHAPSILTLLAVITVLWETYFPILIWVPQIKKYVIYIGVFLHLGIAVMMNLYEFSFVMLAAYPLFMDKKMTHQLYEWLRLKPLIGRLVS